MKVYTGSSDCLQKIWYLWPIKIWNKAKQMCLKVYKPLKCLTGSDTILFLISDEADG